MGAFFSFMCFSLEGRGFLLALGSIWKDVWITVALREATVLGMSASFLPPSKTRIQDSAIHTESTALPPLQAPGTNPQNLVVVTYYMLLEGQSPPFSP